MVYYVKGLRFAGHKPTRISKDGEFVRTPVVFRNKLSSEPNAKFPLVAKPRRYHLYSSHSCPWSQSATLAVKLRGLEASNHIGITYALPIRDDAYGWEFITKDNNTDTDDDKKVCSPDPNYGMSHAAKLYLKADPEYTGYVTLPILWDTHHETIVSNESMDIIQMLNDIPQTKDENENENENNNNKDAVEALDLFPKELPPESIQTMCESFYTAVNNGVYRAGLAKSQEAYETAVRGIFDRLDELNQLLGTQRFLMGTLQPTAADIRLFVTLVRFDTVYYTLFKCNMRRIADYDHLSHYLRDLYQWPGIGPTVHLQHQIAKHYYTSFDSANPKLIIPKAGYPNLGAFHNRAAKFPMISEAQDVHKQGIAGNDAVKGTKGEFVRGASNFRNIITADGSSGYKAEAGRYHLIISNNCPWCHRVQLTRHILGLQDVIGVDVLWYRRDAERGWQYNPSEPGCTQMPEPSLGIEKYIPELYERVGSKERSVPILWDKQTKTIVSNESAEIMRMMNDAFGEFSSVASSPTTPLNLVPSHLEDEIDRINIFTYKDVNNGAYRAGFASTQEAYEKAHDTFFDALDTLDRVLQFRPFLVGSQVTEADVRLFPTIYRFDHVYFNRFLLRKKRIRDYTYLYAWLLRMLDLKGVQEASNLDHCKKGYFGRSNNGLVPLGPAFDFEEPVPPQF
jgi:putative glutathione S-transferase